MPRQDQPGVAHGEGLLLFPPGNHVLDIFPGQGRVGQHDLDIRGLEFLPDLPDRLQPLQLVFQHPPPGCVVRRQGRSPPVHLLQLAPVNLPHPVQIQGVQLLGHEPDRSLAPGLAHRPVQDRHPRRHQLLRPFGMDGQGAVGPAFQPVAVRVPGDVVLRRLRRHQRNQVQQGLHLPMVPQHVPRHHDAGVPGGPQGCPDRLLPFPQLRPVQVAQVQNRILLQILRQVQDRQVLLLQLHMAGDNKVGDQQPRNQQGQKDQHPVPESVPAFPPAFPVRRKDIPVPLPPCHAAAPFLPNPHPLL